MGIVEPDKLPNSTSPAVSPGYRESVHSRVHDPKSTFSDGDKCCLGLMKKSESGDDVVEIVASAEAYNATVMHNIPLLEGHVKVNVTMVHEGFRERQLPVPLESADAFLLAHAVGTFVQWPRNLIFFEGQMLEMHDLLEMFEPDFCEFSIPLPKKMFNYTSDDFTTIINRDDLTQFCNGASINITIIQGFMLFMSKKMEELGITNIGFLCPEICSEETLNQGRSKYTIQYLTRALQDMFDKDLLLLPCNKSHQWILIVVCPRTSQCYLFDPSYTPKPKLLGALNLAYKAASFSKGIRKPLSIDNVKCRKQPGPSECGYYVMRYMFEIINHNILDVGIDLKANESPYTTMELNEIRDVWAKYFIDVISYL